MNNIVALDNLRKLASDFRSDVYKRDEADYVLEIADEIEREINERYIPKPDVPTNKKTELTGITDIHEAARNLMGCATFVIGTGRNLTVDDFRDALGALVSIADMYYFKLPVDADGVSIHVGDVMQQNGKCIGTVTAVGKHIEARAWVLPEGKNVSISYIADGIKHVKLDPLKELLEELVSEARQDSRDFSVEPWCDAVRELLGGDAE